ncbi:MAG: Rieske 2Fe-2S domain-containing protein [Chloroflexota bacterium]
MLSKEENDILCRVGHGTPMGELFRRFWIPVLLASEIPAPDCTPVKVRILGEDLIAFRDSEGNPGLVDAYCPHRGAPMFFGRNEESGLRCVYHGWKFDVSGQCVDLPNVPEGEELKNRTSIPAYPCRNKAGLIWAYLGPREKEPPFVEFEWLELPETHRYVSKFVVNCNYFQAVEGDFDPSHASFLHSTLDGNRSNKAMQVFQRDTFFDKTPRYVAIEDTDYGLATFSRAQLADGNQFIGVTHFIMPTYSTAGIATPGVLSSNMRIPIDDENEVHFRLRWSDSPLPASEINEIKYGGYTFPELVPGTWTPKANKSNDYLVDRISQKNISYTGIGPFPIQDLAMVEDQRGPLMNRSMEKLVSSDEGIIRVRRRLIDAAKALMNGEEPAEPWKPGAFRVRSVRIPFPSDLPVSDAVAEVRRRAFANQDTVLQTS